MKLDPVVKKETGYIALWTLILSVLMEAVFLILRKWNLPVLFGNLLGGGAAIGNFLLMGMTLTRALTMEQKKAKMTAIISQIGRYLLLALAMVLGFKLPFLNPWATLIPLLFPGIGIGPEPVPEKVGDDCGDERNGRREAGISGEMQQQIHHAEIDYRADDPNDTEFQKPRPFGWIFDKFKHLSLQRPRGRPF